MTTFSHSHVKRKVQKKSFRAVLNRVMQGEGKNLPPINS